VKVCFPVSSDNGLESTIYGHFASSPLFLIIDTKTKQHNTVPNCDKKNPYAGCNPFSALSGKKLDGIIVAGIGDEALRTMNFCGFRVFQAQSELVSDNIAPMEKKELGELFVMDSHLEGRCSDDGVPRKCNHSHDDDHDHCEHGHEHCC